MDQLENAAPQVHHRASAREVLPSDEDDSVVDLFDSREIFGGFFLLLNVSISLSTTLRTPVPDSPSRCKGACACQGC